MRTGFIRTSIMAPPSKTAPIHRPALDALFEQVASSRLTTICAAAGSGKTIAALQWFNRLKSAGGPSLWLAARAGIADLSSLLRALKEAGVAAGLPWEQLNTAEADMGWLEQLCAARTPKPVLVIDDVQLLHEQALQFLATVIFAARDAMTTILVSRGPIRIPLARFRALGFMVEVGPEQLNFSRAEAEALLSGRPGSQMATAALDKVIAESCGWATGLVILARNYRLRNGGSADDTTLDNRLQAELTDYFNEEVLALQTPAIRDFVVATSILEQLTPTACAALSGSNIEEAHAMLDAVYRAGLFVEPVDLVRSCYVYHPLFRKSVAVALSISAPARASEFHRRASRHFTEAGDGLTALRHAELSGDQEFIADQLECHANELTYAGYLYRIYELSAVLPWSVISSRPMLLLAIAWRRIRHLSFASAERFIDAAAAIADSRPDDVTLGYLVRHRRIMLDAGRDDMRNVEEKAEKLLYELGADEPYLSCTLLAQLMSARRELYHFQDILRLEAETHRALGRLSSDFGSIALKSSVAPTLVVRGKTALARRLLEEALATAESRHGKGSGLAALPALPLAEVLYDLGEFERASSLVEQYLPTVRHWGFVDQLASGYLVEARLAYARGDSVAALSGLEDAHLVAIECGLDRLRVLVVAEQVRILTKSGKTAEARAALRAGSIELESEPLPSSKPLRQDELVAIAWLRIELQGPRLARAERVARRWLEFVKRSAATRSIVAFQLLVAQIAVLRGDRAQAQRAVRKAVELAEPSGWIQMFLDEGEAIGSLLRGAYTSDPELEMTAADVFASRLVALMRGGPGIQLNEDLDRELGPTSNLSAREFDILTMVSGGLRNREIGERLGLTEGTVKWYMQQIYDKMGVRRRNQATLRARQFGILN